MPQPAQMQPTPIYSSAHKDDPGITALQLLEAILEKCSRRADVTVATYAYVQMPQIRRNGNLLAAQAFPLLKIQSKSGTQSNSAAKPLKPLFVLNTGFHGDEIAGPVTVMQHLDEIIDAAHEAGIGIRIYPLTNPSGFHLRQRYNAHNEHPNNDFLRYQLHTGAWVGDLGKATRFKQWLWSDEYREQYGTSDRDVKQLPAETAALVKEIKTLPWQNVKAVLDIHQDVFDEKDSYRGAYTYAYCLGKRHHNKYARIMQKAARIVPLLSNRPINEGYAVAVAADGSASANPAEEPAPATDEHGIIYRFDGSITDVCHKNGVPYTAAIETTAAVPLPLCNRVNLLWIQEMIQLVKNYNG